MGTAGAGLGVGSVTGAGEAASSATGYHIGGSTRRGSVGRTGIGCDASFPSGFVSGSAEAATIGATAASSTRVPGGGVVGQSMIGSDP